MHLSPRFLGALAAVLVTGATGAVLGTVPPMRQSGLDDVLPEASGPSFAWDYRQERPPQDQYAIVTPEGRFEVDELLDRGLYRSRYPEYADAGPVEDAPVELDAAYAVKAPPELAAAIDYAEMPPPENAVAEAPPQVAEVTPRIVNVAAELARQRAE